MTVYYVQKLLFRIPDRASIFNRNRVRHESCKRLVDVERSNRLYCCRSLSTRVKLREIWSNRWLDQPDLNHRRRQISIKFRFHCLFCCRYYSCFVFLLFFFREKWTLVISWGIRMAIFISLRNYSLKNNLHLPFTLLSSFAFIIHANMLCAGTPLLLKSPRIPRNAGSRGSRKALIEGTQFFGKSIDNFFFILPSFFSFFFFF